MALMYISKFNVNSKIYDVYENQEVLHKILEKIMEKINVEKEIIDEDETMYKFCDINKNFEEKYLVGRLVKVFKGERESYNETEDTVDIREDDNCASHITFYFDLRTEQIAFITKRDFGYRQFNQYFKLLLEEYFDDVEFEIYLEKNIDELKEKVYRFKQILKVSVTIIPPNANSEEFKKLFGTNSEEVKETNATKYTQTLSTSAKNDEGINPKTKFFDRMFYGIGKGYGDMIVEGKNTNGERYRITSDEDAPFTRPIGENEKNSLSSIQEKGRAYISELISLKVRMEFNDNKE